MQVSAEDLFEFFVEDHMYNYKLDSIELNEIIRIG